MKSIKLICCFNSVGKTTSSKTEVFEFFNLNRKKVTSYKWNSKCTQLTRRKNDVQKKKLHENIDKVTVDNIIVEAELTKRLNDDENDACAFDVCSATLQRICIPERTLFQLSSDDNRVCDNLYSYYTKHLVECSTLSADVLLKDWSQIPGRDDIYDDIGFVANKKENDENVKENETSDNVDTDVEMHEMDANNEDEMNRLNCSQKTTNSEETPTKRNVDEMPNTCASETCCETSIKSPLECMESDDEDKTIVIDSDDIQSKVDDINSKMRLSGHFADVLEPVLVSNDPLVKPRVVSPDLFADDDEDEDDNAIEICE